MRIIPEPLVMSLEEFNELEEKNYRVESSGTFLECLPHLIWHNNFTLQNHLAMLTHV